MLIVAPLFIACSSDDEFIEPEEIVKDLTAEQFGEDVLITTTRDIPMTRSSLSNSGDSILSIKWADTDTIRLFVNNKSYTYIPKIQADGSTVVFTSIDTMKIKNIEGQKVYAAICGSINDLYMEDGKLRSKTSLGNVRNIKMSDSEWTYMYAIGNIEGGKLNLDFKQMFAFVKVTVPVSSIQNYEYITLYSYNNYIIPTTLDYDMDNGVFTQESIDSDGYNAAFACTDSVSTTTDNKKVLYFPVLPSDGSTGYFVAAYTEKKSQWRPGRPGGESSTTTDMKDIYICDEPEDGMKAGELFCINTAAGHDKSTDMSMDGKVETLATATKGDGISLVFMGQGFVDKEIASGKYEKAMRREMENFFAIEPYKSFREYFNCYMVYRVASTNDMLQYTEIDENNDWEGALDYADKALTMEKGDTVARAIVVYNGNYVGRSATIFTPDGHFASFIMDNYPTLVAHEAGGHGFSLLGDEYVEQGYERVSLPRSEREEIKTYHEKYNAFANIDYNSQNPIWAKFIGDERYASENLGVYEGAFTYGRSVYKPTENSLMNDHMLSHEFNAPSRESIYRHIMMYADSTYKYNESDFYAYDVINMTNGGSEARSRNSVKKASSVPVHHIFQQGRAPIMKKDFSIFKRK